MTGPAETVAAPADAENVALTRSDLAGPGIRRRRCGRGFRYIGPDGAPPCAGELTRIKALVIPPAWEDVWIGPLPGGHIQAVGTDDAGRRQYLYHPRWRELRDQEKFDRMLEFGRALPRIRAVAGRHLRGRPLSRERVLAAAVRLIDLGFFRAGGEEYAARNGSFGLATIRRDHVTCAKGEIARRGVADRPQACRRPRRPRGGRLPGQHARRGPRLLHGPSGHRTVRRRRHDRTGARRPGQRPGVR